MSFLPNSAPVTHVSALPTGRMHLPDRWLFEDGDEDVRTARQDSPDYSFLIEHPSGRKVLFDLGIRKDLQNCPLILRNEFEILLPDVPKDAVDLLAQGSISSRQIDTVIFSHLHFDHVGDCTLFPDADMVVGPGSYEFTYPGYPIDENSPFFSDILSHRKFREVKFERDFALGPFAHAHDFFGDGSLYLVDTPGHMPGHLGAIAHTGDDEWVFMGGDCCHHRSILFNTRPLSVTKGPNGTKSFHHRPDIAADTISKVQRLEKDPRILVALPHDATLDDIMPVFPQRLNGWRNSAWFGKLQERVARLYPGKKGLEAQRIENLNPPVVFR